MKKELTPEELTPEELTPEELTSEELTSEELPKEEKATATAVKTTAVRVLAACEHGQPNDIVNLPSALLKQAKADGLVDDNKAAVAYAHSLKAAK